MMMVVLVVMAVMVMVVVIVVMVVLVVVVVVVIGNLESCSPKVDITWFSSSQVMYLRISAKQMNNKRNKQHLLADYVSEKLYLHYLWVKAMRVDVQ